MLTFLLKQVTCLLAQYLLTLADLLGTNSKMTRSMRRDAKSRAAERSTNVSVTTLLLLLVVLFFERILAGLALLMAGETVSTRDGAERAGYLARHRKHKDAGRCAGCPRGQR